MNDPARTCHVPEIHCRAGTNGPHCTVVGKVALGVVQEQLAASDIPGPAGRSCPLRYRYQTGGGKRYRRRFCGVRQFAPAGYLSQADDGESLARAAPQKLGTRETKEVGTSVTRCLFPIPDPAFRIALVPVHRPLTRLFGAPCGARRPPGL